MSLISRQIEKARQRLTFDPNEASARAEESTPGELNSDQEIAARRRFLHETISDAREAEMVFERIIGGNELQDSNYLARGARTVESVARIAIYDPSGRQLGWGTGFLIAPGLLITNHHVLQAEMWARRSMAHFEYDRDIDSQLRGPVVFALEPNRFFFSDANLDFTVVAVSERAENADRTITSFGYLPMVAGEGKVTEGEWLTIVQHPNGERKQLCIRENQLIKRDTDVLWYSTDTLGGSSGSPVFNNDWVVVALHHSGVPCTDDQGRTLTLDGQVFDPVRMDESRIKWLANEGIRVTRIVETLRARFPREALLQPVFNATPEVVREMKLGVSPQLLSQVVFTGASQPADPGNASFDFLITDTYPNSTRPAATMNPSTDSSSRLTSSDRITLQRTPDGTYRIVGLDGSLPSTNGNGNGNGNGRSHDAIEATLFQEKTRTPRPPAFDVPFVADYSDRKGFDPDFLGTGDYRVNLPTLSPALKVAAAKLIEPQGSNDNVLHYHNFSVVMHAKRRFALYSAANLSIAGRFDLSRPSDTWRIDPRISMEEQIGGFYYANNKFDRGHLTRREDLEFGNSVVEALQSAADTCHFTNCTPQHSQFNQNKELWQGLERHILEQAIFADQFDAQVITGPVLEESDPVYSRFPKIQYPVRFWKVVAAVNASKELFATAYILDQSEVIDRLGIEAVGEIPFDGYKTFQVKISEIERITGLSFTYGASGKSLSDCDPLAGTTPHAVRRARNGRGFRESAMVATADQPSGYLPLSGVEDAYLGA